MILIFDECVSDCVLNVHKLITVNKHVANDVMIVILILLSSLCIIEMVLSKKHYHALASQWIHYEAILVHHRTKSNRLAMLKCQ